MRAFPRSTRLTLAATLPRALGWIPFLLALSLSTAAGAANRCRLTMTAPVPVRMVDRQPVVSAVINGTKVQFVVDTGSFWDFITPAAAAQFKLPLSPAPPYYYVRGIGGLFTPKIATVDAFSVAGIGPYSAQFLVDDNDFQDDIVGVLGQNIFRLADVEFDFANGMLRFVKPQYCGDEILAYWATGKPVGIVPVEWTSAERSDLIARASVNGHDIKAIFDTGSWRSVLSLDAAKRAGITPDSPGVTFAGATVGFGSKPVKVWAAPIDTFEIGGEAIQHTHLLIGDIGLTRADMLLGEDFFLAHHIYVAYSQNKLYFTYNGGPVFDVNTQSKAQAATAASGMPTDAAGFMRRGMADASRGEFARAIADLTRACQLAPTDADCLYQRGLAYSRSNQPKAALADFSAAIQRRPDDFEAYLARAQLEEDSQAAAAQTDLDAVDRIAPPQADQRLDLAGLYDDAGEYGGAVHQYDLWIEYHPDEVSRPFVLSSRCGSEAEANVDLDRALEDCNAALRGIRKSGMAQALAMALRNRGLVYLRLHSPKQAVEDYDAALQIDPKMPSALYGRGLAELRLGEKAQGESDLAAAGKLDTGIARRYAKKGLAP